jgi:hypothetical protein
MKYSSLARRRDFYGTRMTRIQLILADYFILIFLIRDNLWTISQRVPAVAGPSASG